MTARRAIRAASTMRLCAVSRLVRLRRRICGCQMAERGVSEVTKRHSMLAQLGRNASEAIRRFREFIIFEKSAIKIEYLVCYKRTREALQRAATSAPTPGIGRC